MTNARVAVRILGHVALDVIIQTQSPLVFEHCHRSRGHRLRDRAPIGRGVRRERDVQRDVRRPESTSIDLVLAATEDDGTVEWPTPMQIDEEAVGQLADVVR